MKLLLSFGAITLGLFVSGQTDIISTRSHAREIHSSVTLDRGNFGIDEPSSELKKIEYIGNGCIIESKEWYYGDGIIRDTSCHNPLFIELDYNVKRIKEYFPNSVKFVGFDKYKKEKKTSRRTDDSNIPWYVAISLIGYTSYIFFPKLTAKKVKS